VVGWQAELELGFRRDATRTVLSSRRHRGPLLVQRPFYPEGEVCHVYLVHPPGGIVAGDQLRLVAAGASGSHALLTTPAATKFYRAAPGREALLVQTLTLDDSVMEWLPQENIFFCGAQARVTTQVHLTRRSRFIGWEVSCYGRPAGNQWFTQGTLRQAFEIWCEGQPSVLDHLCVEGASPMMQAPWGLAGHTALGSLLAYPALQEDVMDLRSLCPQGAHPDLSVSLADNVLVCRVAGAQGEQVRARLLSVWRFLRPRLLQREALPPRIWAT
jgi:urease accessory protein